MEGKVASARATILRQPTVVSGIIAFDTRWTLANSPYRISGTIQIAQGATLTVEPGVSVFGSGNALEVFGTLSAVGTQTSRIQFDDVRIVPRSTNRDGAPAFLIRLEYGDVRAGSLYAPTGNAIYGRLILRESRLADVREYMYLWYPVGETVIERNVFLRSGGISIGTDNRLSPVRVTIRNNVFREWTEQFGGHFAVENWVSYGSNVITLERNSFLSTDRIAVRLPVGYSDARLSAINNYWGTTAQGTIANMIFDSTKDLRSAGVIPFLPFLTAPDPSTPFP